LAPADALALRREGSEAVIARLRQQLDATEHSAAKSKASVAKSDAVILELRSTVRQLKRQVDNNASGHGKNGHHSNSNQTSPSHRAIRSTPSLDGSVNSQQSNGRTTAQQTMARETAAVISELQVQLDRAHAQLATADMVRKELEDTLEAEQYTWELRVQDQEREISELSKHVTLLQNEIDQTVAERQATKDQEGDVETTNNPLTTSSNEHLEWKERLMALEQERHELQGCLDEALKELEAVDAELQNDGTALLREENERLQTLISAYEAQQEQKAEKQQQKQQQRDGTVRSTEPDTTASNAVMEPLQHLYRWMLEREGKSDDSIHLKLHETPSDIVTDIQAHVEGSSTTLTLRAKELEEQIASYQKDLQTKEDTCTELRANLKEAVALLKPLQENTAKADREKAKLQDQLVKAQSGEDAALTEIRSLKQRLNATEDELDQRKQDIESLELQLSKAKLAAANNMITQQNNSNNRSLEVSRSPDDHDASNERSPPNIDELRAKRQSENTLKSLLRDAQSRFQSLHQQNQQVAAMNNELQGRLREAADTSAESSGEDATKLLETIQAHESRIHELEQETSSLRLELSKKDNELEALQTELTAAKAHAKEVESSGANDQLVRQAELRVRELENELSEKAKALAAKRDTERILNKSLKDALSLIKPLQMHLEEAEQEKRAIAHELMVVRNNTSGTNGSRSVDSQGANNDAIVRDLEVTVRHLEKENAQLQDALEEMSQSLNASHLHSVDVSTQSSTRQLPHQSQNHQPANKSEARLREEIVELKSRYEVTQARLQDSFAENQSLVDSLQKRELNDSDLVHEVSVLREKLQSAEKELDNAKYIATSALVKIDELNMAEQLELNAIDHEKLYKQKERELDQEMRLARQHQSKVPYRLA
jgi:hypothetical protein